MLFNVEMLTKAVTGALPSYKRPGTRWGTAVLSYTCRDFEEASGVAVLIARGANRSSYRMKQSQSALSEVPTPSRSGRSHCVQCFLTQFFGQVLSPRMVVALEHPQILVSRNTGQFKDIAQALGK